MATFQEINGNFEGVYIFIQSRMTSKRLPGKALLKMYDGQPIIKHVIDRCRMTDYPVVVLIPWTSGNEELKKYLVENSIEHFAGEEDNVLERFWNAANHYQARTVVRITADCPFISPLAIRWAISAYFGHHTRKRVSYVSLDAKNGVPAGFDVEVFSFEALDKAYHKARTAYDREHVTPWIRDHEKCAWPDVPLAFPAGNYTIDTQEDYDRLRTMDPPNLYLNTGS